MTTRKYDFVTGIETSTAPTATDPVNPSDPVILDYAERRFVQGTETQATITALKALATSDRVNGDIVFVKDQDVAFRYDSGSSATADDFFYLLPASGTGRWVRITEFDHATGDLTIPRDLLVTRHAVITGDLTVNGTTTTINTTTLDVEDPNINVNNGGTQATANSAGAGINVEMSDATHAALSYDSTLNSKFKIGNIGSQSEVITQANAQTMSGIKSFTASPNVTPTINFSEQGSTPATPTATYRGLYATSTGFKQIDSAGLVSDLGGGGGSGSGEINVIDDSSSATGWVASGAGVTVATSVTASELPLDGVIASGIKITPVSGTDYVRYRFTMPEGLWNTKLKISWYQEALSGYAAGDLKVELHTNTASDYTGTDATLALSTDSSGVSAIPATKGLYYTTFDGNSSLYYELRIIRVAGTTAVVLQNVVVGPGTLVQGAIVTPWQSYTPTTQGFGTLGGVVANYRRVGEAIEIRGYLITGTCTATEARLNLPTGLTIGGTGTAHVVGEGARDATTIGKFVRLLGTAGNAYINFTLQADNNTAQTQMAAENGNAVSGDGAKLAFTTFAIPVAEWAGGGNVNLGVNEVDYAWSTQAFDQTGTTTSYGPGGQVTANLAGTLKAKTITWLTPSQPGDSQSIELSFDQITWFDSALYAPYRQNDAGSNIYGVLITGSTATTTSIQFNGYRIGATDDSPQTDWGTSLYWRVKRVRGGAAVGWGQATTSVRGISTLPAKAVTTISSGNQNVTSASFVNITNFELSITIYRTSRIFFNFTTSYRNTAAAGTATEFNVDINSVQQFGSGGGVYTQHDTASYFRAITVSGLSQELSPGTYTARLQARSATGTITCLADANNVTRISLFEV